MYCQQCGKQIDDGAKFCAGCGAQTGTTNQPAQAGGASNAAPVPRKTKKPISLPRIIFGGAILIGLLIWGILSFVGNTEVYAMVKVVNQIGDILDANPDAALSSLAPMFRNISLKNCPEEFIDAFNERTSACENDNWDALKRADSKMMAVYGKFHDESN